MVVSVERWKLNLKEYQEQLKTGTANMGKVFLLILGQCSWTIQDRIKAVATWETINNNTDIIEFLKLVYVSLYNQATMKKEVHSFINVEAALQCFRQGEQMSNSKYLEKLKRLIEVFEHMGSKPDTSLARVIQHLPNSEDVRDDKLYENAKWAVHDEYMATINILRSDPWRYGPLITDLVNQHMWEIDRYPMTLTKAYEMVISYRLPQ